MNPTAFRTWAISHFTQHKKVCVEDFAFCYSAMRRNFTVPYRPNRRQNTSLAGWVNWMQKWNRFISTTDKSDFYRTNVFILKHSHCSKQLTSLCLNSKSQICQNWKWIHFILHSIDSAREASENTFAVRQLEFSANITIVLSRRIASVNIKEWAKV